MEVLSKVMCLYYRQPYNTVKGINQTTVRHGLDMEVLSEVMCLFNVSFTLY